MGAHYLEPSSPVQTLWGNLCAYLFTFGNPRWWAPDKSHLFWISRYRITAIPTDHNCNRNIPKEAEIIFTLEISRIGNCVLTFFWLGCDTLRFSFPYPFSILLAGGVSSCLLDNIGMLLEEVVFWWLCLSAFSSALPAPLGHPRIRASSHKTPWRLTVQN